MPRVVVTAQVEDVVPATADAMKVDGVKRDTVKVFVLGKEFKI